MKSSHPHYKVLKVEKLSTEINMNWLRLIMIFRDALSSGSILDQILYKAITI